MKILLISTGDLKRQITSSKNNDKRNCRRILSSPSFLPHSPTLPSSDQNRGHGFADEKGCICSHLGNHRCIEPSDRFRVPLLNPSCNSRYCTGQNALHIRRHPLSGPSLPRLA